MLRSIRDYGAIHEVTNSNQKVNALDSRRSGKRRREFRARATPSIIPRRDDALRDDSTKTFFRYTDVSARIHPPSRHRTTFSPSTPLRIAATPRRALARTSRHPTPPHRRRFHPRTPRSRSPALLVRSVSLVRPSRSPPAPLSRASSSPSSSSSPRPSSSSPSSPRRRRRRRRAFHARIVGARSPLRLARFARRSRRPRASPSRRPLPRRACRRRFVSPTR